jgi:hypothetical protein
MEATRCCVWQSEASSLANLWQTALRAKVDDALCLVELRGFEPLTPCMPSRDPRHSAHHEASRNRGIQQSSRSARGATCGFVEESCCAAAARPERAVRIHGAVGTTFVSPMAVRSVLRVGLLPLCPLWWTSSSGDALGLAEGAPNRLGGRLRQLRQRGPELGRVDRLAPGSRSLQAHHSGLRLHRGSGRYTPQAPRDRRGLRAQLVPPMRPAQSRGQRGDRDPAGVGAGQRPPDEPPGAAPPGPSMAPRHG